MKKNASQSAYLHAYESIRDKVLNGEIAGGTKLVEEKLAKDLGVSRTPIREAIRKLEQEDLIQDKRVVLPTEKDLREIFQVRILLEGFAARASATYMSEEAIEELQKCVDIGRNGTTEEIMKANKAFHEIILDTNNNKVMIKIMDRMQSIIYLFRKTVVYHKRPHLIDEHEQICNAIRNRNPEEAEELMKKHLEADLAFFLHFMGQD
ncbi:GntR family transcriptional regulator [Pseudalkalibacillus hwajinpoensis]|uniref:GntR family transcriptional regulator n=1 Tax=Guptibacillus hwajinpoensis TaxID=208199 RepID=UPI001883FD7F|nr:GntR family transcriptional regulator [Pseudalkalibacillus hwajinpoensis]MBF0706063.1 GntR family transcriptional regulator [Pseudalkalibacillus hwajinpoensis]MCA0991940.1 GntR family transcriptional regulator [Pseudalkalibacillus hwajinpoensis]